MKSIGPTRKPALYRTLYFCIASVVAAGACLVNAEDWTPAETRLTTPWTDDVSVENAHPEYPRPQMVRDDWMNLNGLWDYAIVNRDNEKPAEFDGKILVPYPAESALSGVGKRVGPDNKIWYHRTFTIPGDWENRDILLHFGAVDWGTTVFVNGRRVGTHKGGYDSFTLNITDYLNASGKQKLVVAAWDPTDAGNQPRGKQVRNPGGIWYTPTSGIWQTVWLEPVAKTHIKSFQVTPFFDKSIVEISMNISTPPGITHASVEVYEGSRIVQQAIIGQGVDSNAKTTMISPKISLKIPDAKAWSPKDPFLYNIKFTISHNGRDTDTVRSYFGMRKISLGKDDSGFVRLLLNNKPLFQYGPLDQGFWPDGLYTAPTDAALRYDIEKTKELGFNMIRKHVKIEPARWYYWCDKLGILVWQDMPNGDNRTSESKKQFELELKRLIDGRRNHPSIIMWVPFNEGWGQYDTTRIVNWIEQYDPTRLVNNASGWTDRGAGDVLDIHSYPGPAAPEVQSDRAGVLGEFGGLGLPVRNHTWQDEENWGYRSYENSEELTGAYCSLLNNLRPLIGSEGLAAAVYTQTSDVEIEINGLMTYDRKLTKMNADKVREVNNKLYLPPPVIKTVVPTSKEKGLDWRFTTKTPAEDWFKPGFDDSSWDKGTAGFGEPSTPGSVVRTEWKAGDIWLRRAFELPKDIDLSSLQLLIHHDEDAEVYLNGILIAELEGYTTDYSPVSLDKEAVDAFKPGRNVAAVHCRQTDGGQYIDLGFIQVIEQAKASTQDISVLPRVNAKEHGGLYTGNKPPLTPSPFMKLPIGSIRPDGWLLHMLELEKNGMTGRLKEISPWLNFDLNAWSNPKGEGRYGWEEMPYWLKGYGDLAYILGDEEMIDEARKWIEAAIASQTDDGYFGPPGLRTSLDGKPDMWPHMVMLNVLQSFYEFSGDSRVLSVMKNYFKWQNQLPPECFGAGYWPMLRAGDNIKSVYWLYNRTGDDWLLVLARKIHENMADWDEGVINWHNVNIAQGFREPAIFYMQAHKPVLLDAADRNYREVMGIYGQFPGGGFAGDENCRPGFTDPRQGFETCGIVEFMHSFEMLTRISGAPTWADRCEEITFNSFPASMTPDLKGLHYLTAANQVQLDRNNKSPGIQNGGTMFSYSPFRCYRCCQHNVSHGWPYYAEEIWLATWDNGLCASLYAESEVKAKVGDSNLVRITEKTSYPFDEKIEFTMAMDDDTAFPLYLRIPSWCKTPALKINGTQTDVDATPSSYIRINRTWHNGDSVELTLPMEIDVQRWPKSQNAASVSYGPLYFSLEIMERWEKYGDNAEWPEWEVFPDSSWNYGLVLDKQSPGKSMQLVKSRDNVSLQPFTPQSVPLTIKAKAKRIPEWQMDRFKLASELQPSPVASKEPTETVTLIPMGAARLRVSAFPVIGSGENAHKWEAPKIPQPKPYNPTASHVFGSDTVNALCDDLEPDNSNDQSIQRFTWWDHRGTTEWVQYEFEKPKLISSTSVYWFDDTGAGQCRVPESWRLLYLDDGQWKQVTTSDKFGTELNEYNTVKFKSVETKALRIEAKLQSDFSGGILEWKIK